MQKELKGAGVKIAILDSGIKSDHPSFVTKPYKGVFLEYNENTGEVEICKDCTDKIGHGTAVYGIINRIVPGAKITVFKIFTDELELDSDTFTLFLEHVSKYDNFDIINLSLGTTLCENVAELNRLCEEISDRGTMIVSAFDNGGAVSFPAALESVIGVDSSLDFKTIRAYQYVENGIVDIVGKGTFQRVAWNDPDYIISQGNSFTCAYITALIAEAIYSGVKGSVQIKQWLKKNATVINSDEAPKNDRTKYEDLKIEKAVLFPFNKEIHALVRYHNMLDFAIEGVYDVTKSSRVGAHVSKFLHKEKTDKEFVIQDIKNLDLSSFDTMILGHTDELQTLIGEPNFTQNLIQHLVDNGKKIYAFDEHPNISNNIFYNRVDRSDVPLNQFGKLYQNTKPVLGVVGTSSRQGKFTLQLYLRQKFLEDGYGVGGLGTEPSSMLFGMEGTFPCGYNTSVHIYNEDIILYLNKLMWDISQKDNDIVIVGSQASVLTYATSNINTYPLVHQQYLQATAPDAIIICVNPFDEISFVVDCIKATEALSKGKVIAGVCFPMKLKEHWSGSFGSKEPITKEEASLFKQKYEKDLGIPFYTLGVNEQMESLYQDCISFFCE
ncbi:MAG: S8 family serine peptidase [Clostridiaceae bacterium]|nr:S8 family serine peptidase [Clostridiaceae bacterium]